jgi:hypothetical protein
MYRDRARLLIAFKSSLLPAQAELLLEPFNLVLEKESDIPSPEESLQKVNINHTGNHFWFKSASMDLIAPSQITTIELILGSQINWIGPVYRLAGAASHQGFYCPLPDVLLVKDSGDPTKESTVRELLAKYKMKENVDKSLCFGKFRYYVARDPKSHSAYKIRTILEHVAEVLFENMPMVVRKPIPRHTLIADRKLNPLSLQRVFA